MAARNGSGNSGLQADYTRCAEITRSSSSNFYYAFMLLPAERRRALHAVYAFCRFIDDIADDVSTGDAGSLLTRWREELDRVYAGAPTRAISRALADSARHFTIPRRYFEEIIAGVEMDLTRKRYGNFEELRLYCYRVASAVGLICIEIFGYTNPAARIYAEKLGIAFQITNILRDVKEDAGRGRIYLPLEDLARFGVTEDEILHGVYSSNFVRLMQFEAARAHQFYREAEAALPAEDRSSLLTAEAMRGIYAALLDRIVRSNYRVLDRRLSLPALLKLYLVGRAWASGRLASLRG
jgi:15-cis-phytoene synthase